MEPLPVETLDTVQNAVKEFKPLYPDVPLECRFAEKTKGLFNIKAPHYLIISGQGNAGEKECAGFLFEQLVLLLDTMDIGCVWLGTSKEAEKSRNKNDIIALALGRGVEPVHRSEDDFMRKAMSEITNAPDDVCIQAARLAPSGMNIQPWYFEKNDDKILLYQKKLKPPFSFVYRHTELDMGIALCHYALACEATGKPFAFTRTADIQPKPGFAPFGVIE
jgi:hypothetical protein